MGHDYGNDCLRDGRGIVPAVGSGLNSTERSFLKHMATIVNNPDRSYEDFEGVGFLIGILVVILLGVLFFAYTLPSLRNNGSGTNINVPDRINVDVNR